jgi:RNA polymerase sigma factor (sigma-70 family)
MGDSDLVQDTFTTAFQEFEQFNGRSPHELLAWLERILDRHTLNQLAHFKAKKRDIDRERPLDISYGNYAEHGPSRSECTSPCDLLIGEEDLRFARQALGHLPAAYRVVLELHYREGESVAAIAAQLGLTEAAVRKRWLRGLVMWREAASLFRGTEGMAQSPPRSC